MQEVCAFANATGWKIIWGLNANIGYNETLDHAWQPSDARKLINYVMKTGCPVVGYELGNELNLGGSKSPSQLGKGKFSPKLQAGHFRSLEILLKETYGSIGDGTTLSPFIIGPDVTHAGVGADGNAPFYLRNFLGNFTCNDWGVDAVTYHHYFSSKSTASDLTSAPLLDTLKATLHDALADFETYNGSKRAQLWLGETGLSLNNKTCPALPIGKYGVYCGGSSEGAQCYFGGTVSYLDKLGLAGRLGHSVVARQSLTNILPVGTYDGFRVEPVPEYFAALLHKKLMGTRILAIENDLDDGRTLRAYAACGASKDGSVSMFAMNLEDVDASVVLGVDGFGNALVDAVNVFTLTSDKESSSWESTSVFVNGAALTVGDDGALPDLLPQTIDLNTPVHLPAKSILFANIKGTAAASACA